MQSLLLSDISRGSLRHMLLWGCLSLLFLLAGDLGHHLEAAVSQKEENKVKSAYLYNFLLLGTWPSEKDGVADGTIHISIVDPQQRFDQRIISTIEQKKVGTHRILIDYFRDFPSASDVRASHLLYLASGDLAGQQKLLAALSGIPILTVSDQPGFLEAGGMIEFWTSNRRIRFRLHKAHMSKAKVVFPSQLFELATSVVQ